MSKKNVVSGVALVAAVLIQGPAVASEPTSLPQVDVQQLSLTDSGELLLLDSDLASKVSTVNPSGDSVRADINPGCTVNHCPP